MRDLENPGIWTETFKTTTWVEYIRHNQRRTQADAENFRSPARPSPRQRSGRMFTA